jgi:4-hydroxy-tetrahydrodipicolinate synthase
MIEHLVAAGVHGIINGGSTGEYYAQSMEERWSLPRWRARSSPGAWR